MSKVQRKSGTSQKTQRDRRLLAKARRENGAGQPVSEGICLAARRAGIDPAEDSTRVTMMQGDVVYMVGELKQVFEDVLDADDCPDGGSRDVCVLSALRRLRTVQIMLTGTAVVS